MPGTPPAGATCCGGRFRQREITKITTPVPTKRYTLGNTQATRLKPDFGGSAYTFVPNSCTNICVMASSESPRDNDRFNSFSMLADVLQPTWLHSVSTWLHPHMHMNFPPICLARSVSCCAPTGVINSGTIANIASIVMAPIARALVMALSQGNRRRESVRQWLRGRLLRASEHQHCAAIRQQRHQRSKHHHHSAEPDPLHQRIQIGMQHGKFRIRTLSRIDHVQVFLQRRVNRHHRAVFLGGRWWRFT